MSKTSKKPSPKSKPREKAPTTTGTRLRALRQSRSLSLAQVVSTLGLSSEIVLSRIERGQSTPSLSTLVALAELYKVSLDYLCGRTDVAFNPTDPFWKAVHTKLAGLPEQDRERVRKTLEFTVDNL